MSRAFKEEIAAENALYERLILALTEALTALSSEDLQKWGSRSGLFTNLDQQIDAVIESARGREQIARHHLCVLAFKIVNPLLGKIDAGETDRQYQKRMLSRIGAAATRTSATSLRE
jgi:hypothetical protein